MFQKQKALILSFKAWSLSLKNVACFFILLLGMTWNSALAENLSDSDYAMLDLSVQSKSGIKLPVNFVLPKQKITPKGVIIYVHGGGAENGRPPRGIDYPMVPFAKRLLNEGYIIVNAAYRGDTIEEAGNYLELKDDEDRHPNDFYYGEMLDLLAIEDLIKRQYPSLKMLYHGCSHGSFLVNLLAGKHANSTKAIGFFSDSGIWDLVTASNDPSGEERMSWYLHPEILTPKVNWDDYAKQWDISNPEIIGVKAAREKLKSRLDNGEKYFVVFYSPQRPKFKDRNPSAFLSKVKQPLLVRHGRKDLSVPFKQHEFLKHQLRSNPNSNIRLIDSPNNHCIQADDSEEIQMYFNFVNQQFEL